MRRPAWFTLLVLSLLGGCAHVKPNPLPPPPAQIAPPASAPAKFSAEIAAPPPQPPPPAAAEVKSEAASPVATSPAPAAKPASATRTKTKAEQKAPPPATVAASAPSSTPKPQLDFNTLVRRLRETPAIGVFTKLSIKNQVDDLLGAFRGYYAGKVPPTLDDLHERYDGLVLKVVTLVQNGDATLASNISASRGAIWDRLSNRESFQAI
jgi:hypothetical protein